MFSIAAISFVLMVESIPQYCYLGLSSAICVQEYLNIFLAMVSRLRAHR